MLLNVENGHTRLPPNSRLLRRCELTFISLYSIVLREIDGAQPVVASELDLVKEEPQKVVEEAKQLDADLESSDESEGAQNAILAEILPSKTKKEPKQRALPQDQREKDIESLLFGSASSFADFAGEQEEEIPDDEETLSPDHFSEYSTDDEETEHHVLGLKTAKDAEVCNVCLGPFLVSNPEY